MGLVGDGVEDEGEDEGTRGGDRMCKGWKTKLG